MGENASDTETYDAQMIKSVAADGDATAFMTDHFSLYVTADTEEIICYEVNFYYKDAEGNDVLISGPQYVEDGKQQKRQQCRIVMDTGLQAGIKISVK